jgi:hypothetical protein
MTRVGWLADEAGYIGGAELTTAEFRAAARRASRLSTVRPARSSSGVTGT